MPGGITRRLTHHARTGSAQRAARGLAATIAAFALTCFGVACSDSTAPPTPSLSLTLIVDQIHDSVSMVGPDNVPSIACDVNFRATATGTARATWTGATIRWFAGVGDSIQFDSAAISTADIQNAWGSPDIGGGESQESRWLVNASVPFRAVFEYHYQLEGESEQTVPVTVDCGPSAPAGTPAPSVTALAVHPEGSEIEPGDTLSVEYTATSPVGLWATDVFFSGPCALRRTILDSLQTSVSRTVKFKIPADCRLGLPITISVRSTGVGLQSGSRTLATELAVVDKTPPRIESLAFPSPVGLPQQDMRDDYFAGDSVSVTVRASDNRSLHALVWELQPAGIKDSLILPSVESDATISVKLPPIPIPNGLTGPVQLRLYARDAVGLTSDTVISPQAGTTLVHPTVERPTAMATVPGEIRDVLVDSRRGVVYLSQPSQQRIAILSLSAMTVTATVALPSAPSGMDLSPSGDTLVVLLPDQAALGVIDLTQSSPQPSIVPLIDFDTTTIDQRDTPIRFAANGKIFLAPQGPEYGSFMILEVDLVTGVQRIRTDAGVGGVPGEGGVLADDRIARSLDHTVLVFGDAMAYLQRYDSRTDSFGPPLRPGSDIVGDIWVDATGQRAVKARSIYDGSLQFLRNIRAPGPSDFLPPVVMSAAGDVVYEAVSFEGIVRASVDDGMLLDRSRIPIVPAFVRISEDGTLLVVVESMRGTTTRIATIDVR